MNLKIFVFTLTLIITNTLNIIHSYAQDSNETILNINERILNRMDGLTTKINDLERKVYQGKDIVVSSPENNTISNASDLKKIAGHERRLLELEERSRSIKGIIEELAYVRQQIDKLTQLNFILQSKLDIMSNKNIDVVKTTNMQNSLEDKVTEEYPIYPSMPNKKENNELNVISDNENNSTVEVLAKISPDDGNDQITKENINKPAGILLIEQDKEIIEITKDNSVVSAPKNPEEIYQRAYNMLSKGNYEAAEIAFIKFIQDYSDHSLSSNAYYWLGETFYVRRNYQLAAINFAAGYKKFPKGSKASDQLLKLGISLYSLNKKTEACATFKKLETEFSNTPSRISNRTKTFKEKLDCK